MTIKDSRGLWSALSALELSSSPKIAEMLKPFSRPVADCYECGVEVPTLSGKHEKRPDICVAALFLKRLLNDLRATWNLLLLGYTSQAGTVAAAAFENALIINCVVGNIHRAEKFLKYKYGGSPWSVVDLCKMHTCQLMAESKDLEKKLTDIQGVEYWEILYAQYMWLCKVKHPTIPSVIHDAFSVSLTGADYIIMAAPDVRKEDIPNKAFILTVILLRIIEAIDRFALVRELDSEDPCVKAWEERFDSIGTNLGKAVRPIMKKTRLPFDHKGRMFKRERNQEVF